jgi:ferredoxin
MANKDSKWPDNSKGKVYVDETCIACDACVTSAPNNFAMNDDAGHAFVSKQPASSQEEDQVREAMEGCPVEAIGNDGEG